MANVSRPGLDPSVIVAPDYQVQIQQAERQRALAAALRQQALEDTNPGKGSISWTQGLARIADALSANALTKRADKTQVGANRAYAAGMQKLFGGGQPASGDIVASQPAPTTVPAAAAQAGMDPRLLQQQGATGSPVPQAQPSQQPTDPLAPLPDAPPQAAPQPPSAQPQAPTGGAFNLTGNPNRDMAMYVMNPDKYSEQIIANAGKGTAPTDMEVALSHAQQALARGDVATATALLGNIQKQNYIAPTAGRPGGWTIFPDGRKEFNPQAPIPGAVPGQPDANGNMTWSVPAGVEDAVRERAQSQSGGEAAGKAPYQFQQVYNPATKQMEYVPVSAMTGGPSSGGSPSGGSTLGGYYGQRQGQGAPQTFAAAPPVGSVAAANTAGSNSANQFNEAIGAAGTAKNANFQLDRLLQAANGLVTGPGSEGISHLKSGINAAAGAVGAGPVFDRDRIAKFDEVRKNAAALGLSLSQAVGSQTTDARLKTALDALPNAGYSQPAIQEVGLNLKGLQAAALARGNAAAAWQQQHGPDSFPAFSQTWNNAYNPEVFYNMQKGVPAFQKWAQGLPHAQRTHVLQQYRQMKSLGAF